MGGLWDIRLAAERGFLLDFWRKSEYRLQIIEQIAEKNGCLIYYMVGFFWFAW